MARLFFIIIILSLVVVVSSKFYYENKISDGLDQMAGAAMAVGELKYENVTITQDGEIRIDGLSFRPHGSLEAATVDRIAVRPGSLIKLFQLEKEIRNDRVPQNLGFSVHGVRMPANDDIFNEGFADTSRMINMGMAGCGAPADTTFPGLSTLGYNTVAMNMDLDYEIIGEGEMMNWTINSFAEGIANLQVVLNLRLGAASRNMAVIGMGLNQAQLSGLVLKTEDFGFEKRLLEHCAKSADMPLDQYYSHHIQAWENTWKNMDLQPGENLTAAYKAYIQKPDRFEIELFPSGSFKLQELPVTPPNILIYHLKGNVKANDMEAKPLDLVAFTGTRPNTITKAETQAKTAEPETTDNIIALSELGNYLYKSVEITLKNGKTYSGQTQSVEAERIQFLRSLGGGQLVMPIKISEIDQIILTE